MKPLVRKCDCRPRLWSAATWALASVVSPWRWTRAVLIVSLAGPGHYLLFVVLAQFTFITEMGHKDFGYWSVFSAERNLKGCGGLSHVLCGIGVAVGWLAQWPQVSIGGLQERVTE